MDEELFRVVCPLGHTVVLRRRTWEFHETKRSDLAGQLPSAERTAREPQIIIRGEDGRLFYYRLGHGNGRTAHCYLQLLIHDHFGNGEEFVVSTAWFTPTLEEGEVLWLAT